FFVIPTEVEESGMTITPDSSASLGITKKCQNDEKNKKSQLNSKVEY
ncbi:MAG: hypothetical protein ACI9XO_004485, partial [Paraglaciecola sp.]